MSMLSDHTVKNGEQAPSIAHCQAPKTRGGPKNQKIPPRGFEPRSPGNTEVSESRVY